MKTREAMTRLIDVKRAVGAVRSVFTRYYDNPSQQSIIAALCSLPPAKATEEEMERMADAIYRCDGSSYCFGANDEDEREPYMAKARAAWAALVGEIK